MNATKVELHRRRVKLASGKLATYYTLRWYGSSGQRHSQALGPDSTWAQAKEARQEKATALANGTELVDRPKRMTVAGLVQYYRQVKGPDLRPRTMLEYGHSAKHVEHVVGADTCIDRITAADVGKLKVYLSDERKVRPATVAKIVTHLKAMLGLATRDGLLARNPLAKCKVRQPEPKAARIYGKADVRAMIANAPSPWWRAFVKLAYTSGLRSGELLNLRWEDVDLIAGQVHVRPKLAATFTVNGWTYSQLPWTAKSRRAYRTVPIPQDTVAMLATYQQQSDGSPYLFLDLPRIRRIGQKQADGTWKADAKLANNMLRGFRMIHHAAGLGSPVGTVHDLRKSWCTAMAAAVPMDTLQRWAGHSNVATTCTYYTRERAEDATRARTAMHDETPPLKLAAG